ncbi:hypothetical protein Nmel_012967 [Mimus melanotis]
MPWKSCRVREDKNEALEGGFSTFPPALHPPPAFSSLLSCIPTSSGKRLLLKLQPVTWTCLFGLCRFPVPRLCFPQGTHPMSSLLSPFCG